MEMLAPRLKAVSATSPSQSFLVVSGIEYYDQDRRLRRERIGPNKVRAEQRYREVMSVRTEGRYIKKSPDARTLFKDLVAWYLELSEVKAKRSYRRDEQSLKRLLPFFGERLLKDLTPALVGITSSCDLLNPLAGHLSIRPNRQQ